MARLEGIVLLGEVGVVGGVESEAGVSVVGVVGSSVVTSVGI